MSAGDNKRLVRRYLDEVWAKGNIEGSASFLSPGYRRHVGPLSPPLSREGQIQRLHAFRNGFPDARVTIEDILGEGDRVAFRFMLRGTHEGVFQEIEPTGIRVEAPGLDIVRIEDNRLAEHWGGVDLSVLLAQLRHSAR
ncbi:MAG: ester cyclase [Actinomycetota bacterium]|nr:ester cyclase [Actinomycetota bacterium]